MTYLLQDAINDGTDSTQAPSAPAAAPQTSSPQSNNTAQVAPPSQADATQGAPSQDASTLQSAMDSIPSLTASDMPRFQRTVGSTLKGMLFGLATGGVPGAVAGAASPTNEAQVVQNRKTIANASAQTAQANATFASMRAAEAVALASAADKRYQYMDEDHQLEVQKAGLENFALAQQSGFVVRAVTPLDGDQQSNSDARWRICKP